MIGGYRSEEDWHTINNLRRKENERREKTLCNWKNGKIAMRNY